MNFLDPSAAKVSFNSSELDSITVSSVARARRLRFLRYCWDQLLEIKRTVGCTFLSLTLLQEVAAITTLLISSKEHCDRTLKMYVILHVVRLILSCPVLVTFVIKNTVKRTRSGSLPGDMRGYQSYTIRNGAFGIRKILFGAELIEVNVEHIPYRSNSYPVENSLGYIQYSTFLQRLCNLIDVIAMFLFIFGNYLILWATECIYKVPKLYISIFVFTIIEYITSFAPLILYFYMNFCVPQLLNVLQNLRNERYSMIRRQREIEHEVSTIRINNQHAKDTALDRKKKQGTYDIHLLEKEAKEEYLSVTLERDTLCCICLSDYEENDTLGRLWCMHYFHKICINRWLVLDQRCPLCKQDFRKR